MSGTAQPRLSLGRVAAAALLVALTTLVTWWIGLDALAEADIVLIYVAVITVVAARAGRSTAIVAAALSVAAFDFFFVPPFYTFFVASSRHVLTFAVMFVVGLFVSTVAARLRRQEAEASLRELRTRSLLALTGATAAAQTATDAARSLAEHAAAVFQRDVVVLTPDAHGELVAQGSLGDRALAGADLDVVKRVHREGAPAGRGTGSAAASPFLALPLVARATVEGVLVVFTRSTEQQHALEHGAEHVLDAAQHELAEAFARQTAATLERLRLADEARAVAVKRKTEETRSALLSAVSHDLRTPLGAITGAATTLLEGAASLEEKDRRALLEAIAEQGFHLERLVASLLDMTRVESGALVLRREWVPVEEIVGSALARMGRRLQTRSVRADLHKDVPLLHVDALLFEQVLFNLLDNAAKHTPEGTRIEIRAALQGDDVVIDVSDEGPGLPEGIDVFEKFVRGPTSTRVGLGLGLSICRSIVEAHDGRIVAGPGPRGGTRFVITLPAPPAPPEPPKEISP